MADEPIPPEISALDKTHHIPIAELTPLLSLPSSRSIKAVVSLTWPYSSATGSVAFLLSEPDFRLRRTRGQVRVQFSGSSAKSVAKSGISSGDDVLLSLDGVEWLNNEEKVSTPGRGVEFELKFTERLLLEFQQSGSQDVRHVNVDHPESESTPEQAPIFPDQIPAPKPFLSPAISSVGDRPTKPVVVAKDVDLYSTPQFLKRVRTSYGSMFESDYDPFAEEDGTVVGKGRKKSRLSSSWRYPNSRTPTPDFEEPRAATPKRQESVPVQTTPMVDEGCQTIGLEDGSAAEMMVELSRQATKLGSELHATSNGISIPTQPLFGHSDKSVTKTSLFGQNGTSFTTSPSAPHFEQSASSAPIIIQSEVSEAKPPLFEQYVTSVAKTSIFGRHEASSGPELLVVETEDTGKGREQDLHNQQLPSSSRLQPVHSDFLPLVSPLLSNKSSLPSAQIQMVNSDEVEVLQQDDAVYIGDSEPQVREEDDLYEATPPRRSDELPVTSFTGFSNSPTDIPGLGMPQFQESYVLEDQYGHWQGETAQLGHTASPYPDPESQASLSESSPYFDGNFSAGQFQNSHTPDESFPGNQYPEADEKRPAPSWGQRPSAIMYPDLPDPEDALENKSSIYPFQSLASTSMSRSQNDHSQAIDLAESGDEDERRPESDLADGESEGSIEDGEDQYEQEGLRERLSQGELLLRSDPEFEEDFEEDDEEDDRVSEVEGNDDGRGREEYYDEDEFDEAENERYTRYPAEVQQNGEEEDDESYDEDMEDETPQPSVQRVAEVIDLLSSDDEEEAPPAKHSATSQTSLMPSQAYDPRRRQDRESDESIESEEGSIGDEDGDEDEDEDEDENGGDRETRPFVERTEISMKSGPRLPSNAQAEEYTVLDQGGSEVQDDDGEASSVNDGGSEDEAQYVEPHEAAEFLRQEALREEGRRTESSESESHEFERRGDSDINQHEQSSGLDIVGKAAQIVVGSEVANRQPFDPLAKTPERSSPRPSSRSQMFSMDGAYDDPNPLSEVLYPAPPDDQSPQPGLIGGQRHSRQQLEELFSEPSTAHFPTPADTQLTCEVISPGDSVTYDVSEQYLSQTMQDVVHEGTYVVKSTEVLQRETMVIIVEAVKGAPEDDAMIITTDVQETMTAIEESVGDAISTANIEEVVAIQDANATTTGELDKEVAGVGESGIGEHVVVDIDGDDPLESMPDPLVMRQDSPLDGEESQIEEESVVSEDKRQTIAEGDSIENIDYEAAYMLDNMAMRTEIEEAEQVRVGNEDKGEGVSPDMEPQTNKMFRGTSQDAVEVQVDDVGNKYDNQQRISEAPETEEEIFLEIEEQAREEVLKENSIEKDVIQGFSDADDTQADVSLGVASHDPELATGRNRRSHRRTRSNASNISKKEFVQPTTPMKTHKPFVEALNDKRISMVLIEPDQTPKGHDASIELALASLDSPSKQPHDLRKPPVIDLKVKLSRALRLDLSEYTPLKSLRYHINQKVDVLAIATTTPKEAERARSGPRHYNITFHITDSSIAPNHVAEVHVFRPYKEALPIVNAGDGILLRNFQIFSLPGRDFGLRSTQEEASSWAVFNTEDDKAEVRGPPVEFGALEKNHIVAMKYWYETLDSTSKTKISRANGEKFSASVGK